MVFYFWSTAHSPRDSCPFLVYFIQFEPFDSSATGFLEPAPFSGWIAGAHVFIFGLLVLIDWRIWFCQCVVELGCVWTARKCWKKGGNFESWISSFLYFYYCYYYYYYYWLVCLAELWLDIVLRESKFNFCFLVVGVFGEEMMVVLIGVGKFRLWIYESLEMDMWVGFDHSVIWVLLLKWDYNRQVGCAGKWRSRQKIELGIFMLYVALLWKWWKPCLDEAKNKLLSRGPE